MSAPFVAEVRVFGFNFAPTGWAQCNGQLLPISQNTALFSLLGTMYGGDGKSTFALPNMQGSCCLGEGQGPGLSEYFFGQQAGSEFITLLESEMPFHTHNAMVSITPGTLKAPAPDQALARSVNGSIYKTGAPNAQTMAFQSLSVAGGSLPHNNVMPSLVLNYCIAMQGVFPPRT